MRNILFVCIVWGTVIGAVVLVTILLLGGPGQ